MANQAINNIMTRVSVREFTDEEMADIVHRANTYFMYN
jgi:hypothetical protein